MRNSLKRLNLMLLASSPMWLETVGRTETIDHGDLGLGSHVGEPGDIPGCDPLPEDPGLIVGLRSGWFTEIDGTPRVTLSDTAAACPGSETDPLDSGMLCGTSAWVLNFALPPEMREVGMYQLSEHAVSWDLQQQSSEQGLACGSSCGASSTGGFVPGTNGPNGTLELVSMNENCMIGRFTDVDLSNQIVPPPPKLDGVFRAVRCGASP